MRIIAGEFRSRVLKTLQGDNTRPTTDRLREAMFSRLGPYFDHGRVLDLFAGSGAIALEALPLWLMLFLISALNSPNVLSYPIGTKSGS